MESTSVLKRMSDSAERAFRTVYRKESTMTRHVLLEAHAHERRHQAGTDPQE